MRCFRWKLPSILFVAGFAISLPGQAVDTSTPVSSIQIATEFAWKRHPEAAALDARDAEARAAQELAAKITPEPGSVSISSRNDRLNRNLGQQEYEIEMATPLWLPGQKLAHEIEATARVTEAGARRAALRWEVAGEVREAWWNLASARNGNALAVRRLESARALEMDVQRRYKVGDLSRIDANLAQTEMHTAQADLLESEAALTQAEQVFLLLTGKSAPDSLDTEKLTVQISPKQLADTPMSHPLVAKAYSALASARARAKVAWQSQRAAPELALRMVRERGAGEPNYSNSVGIRLKIPFSSGAQIRQANAAAQAEMIQAEYEMQQVRNKVQLTLDQLLRLQKSVGQQVTIAQQSREFAQENLQLAEKAFRLGESDLTTLLRMRAAAFNAESLLDRQRLNQATVISRLNQALGALP